MVQAKYRTIAQDLLGQIRSGAMRPGEQLPTELKLGSKYHASRNTIRGAVQWLALRGLVEAIPGQGTFVAERIQPFVTTLSADPLSSFSGLEGNGWFREVSERGMTAMTTEPQVEVRSAPRYIADQLNVSEGTQIITRRQERYLDQTPFSLQTTAYPMELVKQGASRLLAAEDIPEGTVGYLAQQLGLKQVGHRDRLLFRWPEEDEARFFRLSDDDRCFVASVVRTGYRDGHYGPMPFRVTSTVFLADRNQFVIDSGEVPKDSPGPAAG